MAAIKYDDGIQVTIPDGFVLRDKIEVTGARVRKIKTSGAVEMPSDTGSIHKDDKVIASLGKIGLELVREQLIEPDPQVIRTTRKSGSTGGTAEFKVDLTQNEEAVILLEQDGMYLWKYANQSVAIPSERRRGINTENTQKQLVFQIEIDAKNESGTDKARRDILGKVKEFAWGKIKAYVLKFVASATVELARKHLEKNISRGLIQIKSTTPEDWQLLSSIKNLELPSDRAPKILLFVHGTFSSTLGAFGALGATPWGRSFLQSTLEFYDAVIGFNHATLSNDPLENAQQLLDSLQAREWPVMPQMDVVVHSRGGLVIRCLIEKLLPQTNWQPTFNRVVFVASTNGGTLLAEPKNWESLVNLYTNLAAGACRVIGLIAPQAKAVALVLDDIIQSVGSFVKYCADSSVTNKRMPGLAAMEPDGKFVRDINLAQAGQPGIDSSYYCAITSEFKPQLLGTHEPRELPLRFLTLLGGTFMDRLMKEGNDMVVNTGSMAAIDLELGNFVKERYDFGINPQVYHTNYFTRPEVANALTRWFRLPPVQPNKTDEVTGRPGKRRRSTRGVGTSPSPALIPLPAAVSFEKVLSPKIDTDIITVDAMASVELLKDEITRNVPSFVVVRRPYGGHILNYAFKGEEAIDRISNQDNTPIIDALDLYEHEASGTQQMENEIIPKRYTGGIPTTYRNVVLVDDTPVGVVPEQNELPDAMQLADLARLIANPTTKENHIAFRRTMPTFTPASESGGQLGETPPTKVTCYFRAEMDAEVIVKRATTLIVTVSRELLERINNTASATSSDEVNIEKKIVIRVIARSGFLVDDKNDGRSEIDVPQPNNPQEMFFDVRATEEEGEGEIWVLIRQEQVNVAKLVLKPKVVKTRSLAAEKISADRTTSDPEPLVKPLHQLWIEERKTEDGFVYKYDIYSEGLKIKGQFTSKPIFGDRERYVANLYKQIEDRWLSSGKDEENFAEELRAFGADLFDELIPKDLQKILWERRKDFDSIQVESYEPFIPWELVHLRHPDKKGMPKETIFLGQMGLIRWLQGAGKDGWPTDEIKVRKGRVRYVIPKYPHPDYRLPEAEKEANFLKDKFDAEEVTAESGVVRKLISNPGAFDLLHFACHGVADSGSINEASLLMQGRVEGKDYVIDFLNATTAAKFGNLKADDNEPMVVLNACQAGKAGYKLTGIGGFAHAFLMGGAGAFIGTLWSVGDSPARTFTETMYEALVNGKTLSEATIEARIAAKESREATWLAYVVYGHPHLRIVK